VAAAAPLLLAFMIHPIMAAMGVSFCIFLSLTMMEPPCMAAELASAGAEFRGGRICPSGLGPGAAHWRVA